MGKGRYVYENGWLIFSYLLLCALEFNCQVMIKLGLALLVIVGLVISSPRFFSFLEHIRDVSSTFSGSPLSPSVPGALRPTRLLQQRCIVYLSHGIF